jgi:hypothetical protein
MKQLLLSGTLIALSLSIVGAQQEKNMPTQITTIDHGDVKVRYLNFKWDEEAFEALEKGGDMPGAKRSWAIARLYPAKPIVLNGKRISGGNLLVLNPASGDTPMTLEVRVIDMREVFVDMGVIAEPPAGKTIYKEPADFKKVDTLAERMTLALSEGGGKIKLSVHYGNRLVTLEFDRR